MENILDNRSKPKYLEGIVSMELHSWSELVNDKGDFETCIPLSCQLVFTMTYGPIIYGVKTGLSVG
jgi:hypothetical protein